MNEQMCTVKLDSDDLKNQVNNAVVGNRLITLNEWYINSPQIFCSLLGKIVLQHLDYNNIYLQWVLWELR